jgi:hypothetical protein
MKLAKWGPKTHIHSSRVMPKSNKAYQSILLSPVELPSPICKCLFAHCPFICMSICPTCRNERLHCVQSLAATQATGRWAGQNVANDGEKSVFFCRPCCLTATSIFPVFNPHLENLPFSPRYAKISCHPLCSGLKNCTRHFIIGEDVIYLLLMPACT